MANLFKTSEIEKEYTDSPGKTEEKKNCSFFQRMFGTCPNPDSITKEQHHECSWWRKTLGMCKKTDQPVCECDCKKCLKKCKEFSKEIQKESSAVEPTTIEPTTIEPTAVESADGKSIGELLKETDQSSESVAQKVAKNVDDIQDGMQNIIDSTIKNATDKYNIAKEKARDTFNKNASALDENIKAAAKGAIDKIQEAKAKVDSTGGYKKRKTKRKGKKSKRKGKKSKRKGKKSRRKGKKSRRKGKKSRRKGRKSRRKGRKSRRRK
jgi:hypothetical protein